MIAKSKQTIIPSILNTKIIPDRTIFSVLFSLLFIFTIIIPETMAIKPIIMIRKGRIGKTRSGNFTEKITKLTAKISNVVSRIISCFFISNLPLN